MAKKIMVMAVLAIVLTGCSSGKTSTDTGKDEQKKIEASTVATKEEGIDIDITEERYVQWINEIYTNADSYEGKTIRLQGAYMKEQDATNGNMYDYVYRQGPGCCGNDGSICGFEFAYEGIMPEDDEWIEVIGVLEQYEEDGQTYLRLNADSVRVQEERGNLVLVQ